MYVCMYIYYLFLLVVFLHTKEVIFCKSQENGMSMSQKYGCTGNLHETVNQLYPLMCTRDTGDIHVFF